MDSIIDCFEKFDDGEGFLRVPFDIFESKLLQAGFSYSIRDSSKETTKPAFSHKGIHVDMRKVIPFQNTKRVTYNCSAGKLYYKLKKKNKPDEHITMAKKSRFHVQNTKKQGCAASFSVFYIDFFNDYVLKKDMWHEKKKVLEQLKEDLTSTSTVENIIRETKIYVKMRNEHNHSIVTTQLGQKVDELIKIEIRRIIFEENVTNVALIKTFLKNAIQRSGINISQTSRSFFPDNRTIYNYVLKYSFEKKKTKIDADAVGLKVDEWSKDGRVMYRPFSNTDNEVQSLLFCFQAKWQDDFFKTFGSTMLLDATYKTMKYSLPLFLLVVKTNVNYIPVGFFIIQHEDTRSITEALQVFRSWNPDWKPSYFMVDYSEAEINAINSVFRPPAQVSIKICSFHREQAWDRWLKKSGNLVDKEHKDQILKLWRNVAKSPDTITYEENLSKLENDNIYEVNVKAQNYFLRNWINVKELWVVCFFDAEFLVNITTNNGIESQNKLLKHSFLKTHTDKTMSNILCVIIENYIPTALRNYQIENSKMSSSFKKYNAEIPSFLLNRPVPFIKHVYDRYKSAQNFYGRELVKLGDEDNGVFSVRSENIASVWYEVNWNVPSCQCHDFSSSRLPCKHMCAIMLHLSPKYSFDSLPADYVSNPFYKMNSSHNLFDLALAETNNSELEKKTNPDAGAVNQIQNHPHEKENENDHLVKNNYLKRIRENAKKLIDITYVIDFNNNNNVGDVLNGTIELLENATEKLKKCTGEENNLTLLPKRKKSKKN